MNSSKQIKIGALISYFAIAFNIIAGLIYTPWMVSQIGKSDYGLYTLANTLITIFMMDFGLCGVVSRYVAKYRAEGNEKQIDNFLGAIYKLFLIIDALICIVLLIVFFFIDDIYVKLTPAEMEKFKVVYVLSGFYAVFHFPFMPLNGIMTACEQFIYLKVANLLCKIITIVLTVIALIFGWGLYALVAVHAIAGILTVLMKLISIKRGTSIKVNFRYFDKALYKDIFKFSAWLTVATLAHRLIFNITPSILGMVANSAAIAVFGIITTIEGYTFTISTAINDMFLPKISRIYAKEDSEKNLTPLLLSVGKFQFAIGGMIVAVFAVVGKLFVTLWMGVEFVDAYTGALLIIIPDVFYTALQIANTAMVVQKKVKEQALIAVVTGLINVALSFVFSKLFGVVGAALSIFVAYIFRVVATNVVCYKIMHIDIPKFIKGCYVKMSPPIVITILFGMPLNQLIPDAGWISFIIKAALVGVMYLVLVFAIGLNKAEQKSLINHIPFIKKTQ